MGETEHGSVNWERRETEHIVAILDLLGASEMIFGDSSEVVLNTIAYMFDKAGSTWPHLGNTPAVLGSIKAVTFSDNITFALELSSLQGKEKEEAIKAFIGYITVFQGVALKSKLYFRGGIALGRLYMNSKTNFVWGRALVEAHLLEEKSAIYPRVVLSRQFEQFDLSGFHTIRKDFDGMYFVDYVPHVMKQHPDWIEANKRLIEYQYTSRGAKAGQERVLQKYGWLRRYIQQCEEAGPGR